MVTRQYSTAASIVGSMIEWYDFVLFVYLTPVFSIIFFQTHDFKKGVIYGLMVFAAGNIMRPLGAVLFGHMGDRVGRAKTLQLVLLLMSASNLVMACLPNYQRIGIGATLALVVLRLFQGLCVGGEFSGSMVYLAEHGPAKRRALTTSMINTGSNIGIVLALCLTALLSHFLPRSAFLSYGWRIAYIVGGLFGLFGLFTRFRMKDSELFIQAAKQLACDHLPIHCVYKHNRKAFFTISMQLILSAVGSYVLMMFLSTYLHVFLHYSFPKALSIQTLFVIISIVLIPLFALLSDKLGRRKLLGGTCIGYIILAIPCFYLTVHAQQWWWMIALVVCYCAEQSTTPATIVENYPFENRYTGVAVSYNLVMSIVGGFTPVINAWLISHTGDALSPAYYMMAFTFIVLLNVGFNLKRQFGTQVDLFKSLH